VSADARPLRVAGYGDPVGLAALLRGGGSPETAIALSPIRALVAGPEEFRELVGRRAIRERLIAAAPASHPRLRRARRPS
jgi:CRP-like cAMP-binding protein